MPDVVATLGPCPRASAPPPPPTSWDGMKANVWDRLSAYGSYHTGGANVALGDGGVRFLRQTTTLPVLAGLSTRSGGETVAAD